MHRMIPHYDDEFSKLSLHDQVAVIKYRRLARQIEKQLAKKRRWAERMERKRNGEV